MKWRRVGREIAGGVNDVGEDGFLERSLELWIVGVEGFVKWEVGSEKRLNSFDSSRVIFEDVEKLVEASQLIFVQEGTDRMIPFRLTEVLVLRLRKVRKWDQVHRRK